MSEPPASEARARYWLDGTPTSQVPAGNRGLAYGDGIFRTILVSAGRPVWAERHLSLLLRDAHRLNLAAREEDLSQEILVAARSAVTPFAALRVTVWRDGRGRGYAPHGRASQRLLGLAPYTPDRHAAWTVGLSRHRLWPEPFPGIKHLNRLLAVAAAGEALTQQVPEVLVARGGTRARWPWVTGGRSSLFLLRVRQGTLLIPGTEQAGVEGAGIGWLTAWAGQHGLTIRRPRQLPCPGPNDELGLVNSLLGPRAIGMIRTSHGGQGWLPGTRPAASDPLMTRLQAAFAIDATTPSLV